MTPLAMCTSRRLIAAALLATALAGCSKVELIGSASRTVRNVCANAPNCTVYDADGQADRGLDPWDTRR